MNRDFSFVEVLARVPRDRRSDSLHVLAALWKLHSGVSTPLATRDIAKFLRQHLRGKAPRNVSDTLAKLPPFIERVPLPDTKLSWRITESGLQRLGEVTGLQFQRNQGCMIDFPSLHLRISAAAKDLFFDGHYSEAVGRAAKELNRLVRERTGRTRDDGTQMMHQVFSDSENGVVRLVVGPLREDWERDRQCGLRFMMAGCQVGIANVDKHGQLIFQSDVEALEYLALISHLARQVDRAARVIPSAANDSPTQRLGLKVNQR